MVLSVATLFPFASMAQTLPDYTTIYVNDFATLIDPDTEERLTQYLKDLKSDRSTEMTVVTINSRNDYGQFANIEEFATDLFNHWGIGNADRNDGILVLISRFDRDMCFELGSGFPPSFDDRMKKVIDYSFLPHFKRGQYPEGIEAGVLETIKRTNLVFTEDGPTMGSRISLEGKNAFDKATGGGLLSGVLGFFGLGAGGAMYQKIRRRKPRVCGICGQKMHILTEDADDYYLSQGQKVEESVKSKDYDVWYCEQDDHTRIEGYRNWFTSAKLCPNCDFRTLYSNRKVLTNATYSTTGTAQVDYNCKNCSHSYQELVTIPIKSKSSSSSSGSSFGGGSSSGGGASGSW